MIPIDNGTDAFSVYDPSTALLGKYDGEAQVKDHKAILAKTNYCCHSGCYLVGHYPISAQIGCICGSAVCKWVRAPLQHRSRSIYAAPSGGLLLAYLLLTQEGKSASEHHHTVLHYDRNRIFIFRSGGDSIICKHPYQRVSAG